MKLTAVVLSKVTLVAGCVCPISVKVMRMGMASLQLTKAAPISASAADVATCFRMCVGLRMAPL